MRRWRRLRLGAVDFVQKPEGPLSLHMDVFGPLFVAKVRAAAGAKLKASLRLRERVQHRFGGKRTTRQRVAAGGEAPVRATGDGIVRGRDLNRRASGAGGAARRHCRRLFRGPSSSPSTCRRISPARSPGASTASARSASARSRAPRRSNRATPISGAATATSSSRGSPAVWSRLLRRPTPSRPWHPSADRLVESAMAHVPPDLLIGVLMTGMGDDGAASMTRLRALGGRTIAEAEETAVVWGMPGKLVEAGGATWVLPLQNIAGATEKADAPSCP